MKKFINSFRREKYELYIEMLGRNRGAFMLTYSLGLAPRGVKGQIGWSIKSVVVFRVAMSSKTAEKPVNKPNS